MQKPTNSQILTNVHFFVVLELLCTCMKSNGYGFKLKISVCCALPSIMGLGLTTAGQ
jgi:accessory gene regulator protein AgrB